MVDAVVVISRKQLCDAMPLALPPVPANLLANGPQTPLTLHSPCRVPRQGGPTERQRELRAARASVPDELGP